MKISTNYMFDRATTRMMEVQQRLTTAQARMSTGKKIISPSDAPEQASAIQRLRDQVTRQESHLNTLDAARRRFSTEETALTASGDVLARMKELSLSAANATKNQQAHDAIAAELTSLRDELMSLANTRDDNGNYIFSGTRVTTQPYVMENGQVVFKGDQTQTVVPAGADRDVVYTRSGSDVFVRVVRDVEDANGDPVLDANTGKPQQTSVSFFDAIDSMITAVKDGHVNHIQRAVGEVDALIDGVALAVAQVGSDQSVLDSQTNVIESEVLRLKSSLSSIEDLDYTEAVTQMTKDTMALQAAQSSFAKISQLSLFDYIGR